MSAGGVSGDATEDDAKNAFEAIRQATAKEHGLAVDSVLLLEPRTIPKTTSGKIRRYECRERFLAGTLRVRWRSDGSSGGYGRACE